MSPVQTVIHLDLTNSISCCIIVLKQDFKRRYSIRILKQEHRHFAAHGKAWTRFMKITQENQECPITVFIYWTLFHKSKTAHKSWYAKRRFFQNKQSTTWFPAFTKAATLNFGSCRKTVESRRFTLQKKEKHTQIHLFRILKKHLVRRCKPCPRSSRMNCKIWWIYMFTHSERKCSENDLLRYGRRYFQSL